MDDNECIFCTKKTSYHPFIRKTTFYKSTMKEIPTNSIVEFWKSSSKIAKSSFLLQAKATNSQKNNILSIILLSRMKHVCTTWIKSCNSGYNLSDNAFANFLVYCIKQSYWSPYCIPSLLSVKISQSNHHITWHTLSIKDYLTSFH